MDGSQTLILQRTADLMERVEADYGDGAVVRMSLVAVEVQRPDGEGTDILTEWGDDRPYVREGFAREVLDELEDREWESSDDEA